MGRPVRPSAEVEQSRLDVVSDGTTMGVEVPVAASAAPARKSLLNTILICVFGGLLVVLAGVCTFMLATGRISTQVQLLESEVETLESTIEALERSHAAEIEVLEQAVADSTVHEVVPTTSLQRVEGSESPYLWMIEGDFIAPNTLDLPGTEMSANNSYVQVGSRFVLRPSDRWYLCSQGAICEFWHPNNIWGKVEALTYKGDNTTEVVFKEQLQSFFEGYPSTEISYRRVYLEDRVVGMFAVAEVPIYAPAESDTEVFEESLDSVDGIPRDVVEAAEIGRYVLTVGLIQRGEYALSTLFIHEAGDTSATAQELIRSLFSSCSFGTSGAYLRLE